MITDAIDHDLAHRLQSAVSGDRLLDTAIRLCEVPSPTCEAGAVAERLAEVLRGDGFEVERPVAGWEAAPAVVARLETGRRGRTLQFNGHLDTVHLPFVPPRVEDGTLFGTGAADMKAGVAAAVEAMRALRDAEALPGGGVLLTAHDLHEAPWGDGHQVDALIDAGYVGDGVLLPEYLHACLPVVGRGLAILQIAVRRTGAPVHEVYRPADAADVIAAGCEVVRQLKALDAELALQPDPRAGPASLFIGQVHSGEIYNQYPVECRIEGTRRWLPGDSHAQVEAELRALVDRIAGETGTEIESRFLLVRDAFALEEDAPLVHAFQAAREAAGDSPLPFGAKPFVDDGNSFFARAGVPAITHGPAATGAHTVDERVPVAELARVARTYALTAVGFCGGQGGTGDGREQRHS